MVCFHSSVPVDQQIDMANSVNPTDPCSKLRNKKTPNSSNHLSIPACRESRSAAIDVLILIAVIGAFGFLLFPHIKFLTFHTIEIGGAIIFVVREEVSRSPMIYGCLGLSIFCAVIAVLAITVCTSRKCGKSGCRGLRKAAEFDIQLETEECVKNSSNLAKDSVKKGVFELPRDHHRELESELKKMAPPNGRAVLLFRARCGCSVGRMEVLGPKKPRKSLSPFFPWRLSPMQQTNLMHTDMTFLSGIVIKWIFSMQVTSGFVLFGKPITNQFGMISE